MFRGNHPTRVDEKGRLKVPSEFKRRVDEVYGPAFFITSTDGQQARLYPLKEWERIEEAMAKASGSAKQKFLDVTNYYGQQVEMDQQGRLLLPQLLREKAGLKSDVAVLGQGTKLTVVDTRTFEAKLEAEPLTAAEMDALDVPGI